MVKNMANQNGLQPNIHMSQYIHGAQSPEFLALIKYYRIASGNLSDSDKKELSAQMKAAMLRAIHADYVRFLMFYNLWDQFFKFINMYQPESQIGVIECLCQVILPENLPIKKQILDQVIPTQVDPIHLDKFNKFPAIAAYGFIYREYKQLNFKYQNATTNIYYAGFVNNINVVNNFRNVMNNNLPQAKDIPTELLDEIVRESEEFFRLLNLRKAAVDEEYNKDCLTLDSQGKLVPDFEAMNKRKDFIEREYHEMKTSISSFIHKIKKYGLEIVNDLENAIIAEEHKVEEGIKIVKDFFVPQLEAMKTKLVQLNKEIALEVNEELHNFSDFLELAANQIDDDKVKTKIMECYDTLEKLQTELNEESHDFERLQRILAKCHYQVDEMSSLFLKGQPLCEFTTQHETLMASLAFKASFTPPETFEELDSADYNSRPTYIRISRDEVLRIIRKKPTAPDAGIDDQAPQTQPLRQTLNNTQAPTGKDGLNQQYPINEQPEVIKSTNGTTGLSEKKAISANPDTQRQAHESLEASVQQPGQSPIVQQNLIEQKEIKSQLQEYKNGNNPEHIQFCNRILNELNFMDVPDVLPKTKKSIDSAKGIIQEIKRDGFIAENSSDLLKAMRPIITQSEVLTDCFSEVKEIVKSFQLPPAGPFVV